MTGRGLAAEVTLVRYAESNGPGGFALEVRDQASGIHVLRAELPLRAAADLFSGRSAEAVVNHVSDDARLGLRHEAKTYLVPVTADRPRPFTASDLAFLAHMAEAANPEWTARVPRTYNRHDATGAAYGIVLDRWLP